MVALSDTDEDPELIVEMKESLSMQKGHARGFG